MERRLCKWIWKGGCVNKEKGADGERIYEGVKMAVECGDTLEELSRKGAHFTWMNESSH